MKRHRGQLYISFFVIYSHRQPYSIAVHTFVSIDIDIAFYGQQCFQLDGNQIPDPDILRYAHLALPLADIAPDWYHPDADATLHHIADHLHYNKAEIYRI